MEILIREITKTYGEKQVFQKQSLRLPIGQTTVIMGASGCGKTTLMRLLLGLEQPDCGEILHMPKRTSVVFQEDRLCETCSAQENILLVLDKKKDAALSEFVEHEARQIGLLPEDLRKPVKQLSGGMKRRVALLRAMLYESDVLLMDEPFQGLDAATKEQTMQYVREKSKGKTVILITHDEQEANYFNSHNLIKL